MLLESNMDYLKDISNNDLIEGIIPVGLSMLYAKSKVGKSFLARDIALSLSDPEKESWINNPINKHGFVWYFALDDTRKTIGTRFGNIEDSRVKVIDMKGYLDLLKECGRQRTTDQFQYIVETLLNTYELKKPILIIVDTFEKIRGQETENNKRDYSNEVREIEPLRNICINHNISLLFVHHATKTTGTFSGSEGLGAEFDSFIKASELQTNKVLLEYKSNSISPEKQIIEFDQNTMSIKLSEEIEDEPIDADLRQINELFYRTDEKEFEKSAAELCYLIRTTRSAKGIGKLISNNIDVFRREGIEVNHRTICGERKYIFKKLPFNEDSN